MTDSAISLDEVLKVITSAFKATKESIADLESQVDNALNHPALIKSLLEKLGTSSPENVSLLSLKNSSLLSYINNLAIIVLAHLERIKEGNNFDDVNQIRHEAIERSIVQRACVEKGVKPLERKLNYQFDKMVRTFTRMEEDESRRIEKLNDDRNNDSLASASEEDDNESEEEDGDAMSYRPDIRSLMQLRTKKKLEENSNDRAEKYVPPKISAVAPPSITKPKDGQVRKLQSMEEYLAETSEAPQFETSIGSTIVGHGRGGVKTKHERNKELEIQRYEEENFTRLPSTMTKKSAKGRHKDMVDNFAGENWSMFNNSNTMDATSRKRKPKTAWDKIKKQRL